MLLPTLCQRGFFRFIGQLLITQNIEALAIDLLAKELRPL
ncbi:Uncharacterised protein [Vibrio cholerae]|nr:Uncharacterised protein [Vibrio cholerae]